MIFISASQYGGPEIKISEIELNQGELGNGGGRGESEGGRKFFFLIGRKLNLIHKNT